MSDLSKPKFVPNMTYVDRSKPRVYINPNFNIHNVTNRSLPNNSAMHVNPKFSHLITNVHNTCNKTKIYVNPNFIKPTIKIVDNNLGSSTHVQHKEVCTPEITNPTKYEISTTPTAYQPINNMQTLLPAPISKSRYCLVRQHTANKPQGIISPEQSKNTFKVNKYKSVQWKDIKQNLDLAVSNRTHFIKKYGYSVEKHSKSQKPDACLSKSSDTVNRYKLVNHINKLPVINNTVKTKPLALTKTGIDLQKKVFILNRSLIRIKKTRKGHLKKNNIPCPLFRKFGKCLRNNRGYCEYLHDKKHVSVCRKFIKGICHDRECLLSHDLTVQKMPTCYFYLQGTCLKEDCPYLHVKLNENAKICPDFLKGYCEKGSDCLYRHVNVKLQNRKGTSQAKSKITTGNVREVILDHKDSTIKQVAMHNQNNETALVAEYRYYQENKQDEDTSTTDIVYEVIKPIRCKLGTLPSFIQL